MVYAIPTRDVSTRQLTAGHCPAVPTRASQSDSRRCPRTRRPAPPTTTVTANPTTPTALNLGGPLDTRVHLRPPGAHRAARREFPDGWALSTSAAALQQVLALCPPGVRVCSWQRAVRPTKSKRPISAWEPLIASGGRELATDGPQVVRDALAYGGRYLADRANDARVRQGRNFRKESAF